MAEIYFSGTDSNGQYELWETDGTAVGTTEVTPGLGLSGQTGGLAPSSIFVDGSEVLFDGDDATGNRALWTYTPATAAVSELSVSSPTAPQSGNVLSNPAQFTSFNSLVYFSGYSSSGRTFDLWSTDGTASGTNDLSPIPGQNSSGITPTNLVVLQTQLLFTGEEAGNYGYGQVAEYTSDGTTAGTVPSTIPIAAPAIALGDDLIFSGFDDARNQDELYSSIYGELTPGQGGTQINQSNGINPSSFTLFGSIVLFNGNDAASHHELYTTDGTPNGTLELSGISGESTTGLNPSAGAVVSGRMLFAGYDTTTVNGVQYRGLWSNDGTVGGTYEIAVAGAYQGGVNPLDITAISATQAVFNGEDASGAYGLWITDGTSAGTQEISGIAGAAAGGINPGGFAASPIVACFAAGTRILTLHGEVPVEALAVGDTVVTASGTLKPIKWLGHRHVDCRGHPRSEDVWPVRISPGAFGSAQPCRDLSLSPDHAVYIEGVLIPIKYLINGTTVVQEPRDQVTYWHVEFEQHDVILAEGLPCESYLDTNDRSAFSNGGAVVEMHPSFGPGGGSEAMWEAAGCAPLRIEGGAVDRVIALLHRRAAELGYASESSARHPSMPAPAAMADLADLLQPAWYLTANPDVAAAGVDASTHYVQWAGRREGRRPCPEIDLVRALGLIDPGTLAIIMPDVIAAGVDPVEHFCAVGWTERRSPNPYFDTGWYLDTHAVPAGMNPVLHYVLLGENQGLRPSRHFEPDWYRARYAIGHTVSPLAHYLMHRRSQRFSPLPSFDVAAYCHMHAATLLPERDPYAHFLAIGRFEPAQVVFTESVAA